MLHPGDRLALGPAGLLALEPGEDRMTPRKIENDAVGLHVLHNALANIAAEMAHRDDEDVLLDDLQRGPRLLHHAARPRGQPDRREELRPLDDGRDHLHRALDAGGVGRILLRARRHRRPQRSLSRQLPPARAHADEADLPRRGADRLRRQHRPHGGGRRQGAGQLRLRCDRRLSGGPAPAAGEAHRRRAIQRAALAGDPRQSPHAAQHLGRPPRHDRRPQHRRAPAAGAGRALRRRHASSRARAG